MIVIDTSAWIEFLRDTGSETARTVESVIVSGEAAVTEIVVMELLAGARSDRHHHQLRERLLAFPMLRLSGLADYQQAASIFVACRRGGETVRALADCLVAVPAIREGAAILHRDSDYDAIARHTDLVIHKSA